MRLIDADALKKDLSEFNYDMALRIVDTQFTIDAEPVRHGRWIPKNIIEYMMCSECSEYYKMPFDFDANVYPYNFCPNCGAKMDGD